MRFEVLPKTALTNELIIDFLNKNYAKFLQEADTHYYYWNDIKSLQNLPYEGLLESWSLIKLHRRGNYQRLHFGNKDFNFYATSTLQQSLYQLDKKVLGRLYQHPVQLPNEEHLLLELRYEEAWAAYRLAGGKLDKNTAFGQLKGKSSKKEKKDRLLSNILNALDFAFSNKRTDLDCSFLTDLYTHLHQGLNPEKKDLQFRTTKIVLHNQLEGEVAHIAPDPEKIPPFLTDLMAFINSKSPFFHPLVKASILHFIITYLQPFPTQNGVLAQLLFLWFLNKKDYALTRYLPVSKLILHSTMDYEKAGLQSRNDEHDLTYFVRYMIRCVSLAFERLLLCRNNKAKQLEEANLIAYKIITRGFHKRQADLVGSLYVSEKDSVNITSYAKSQGIVRQTARKDLNALVEAGLIIEHKIGRKVVFKMADKQKVKSYVTVS